jgi:phage virion morphogenesis protein
MGSVVAVNVSEVEQLAKKLNGYALSAGQREALLSDLGEEVEDQTKARFDTETDPKGDPWKALTAKYAKRKAKSSSGGILVKTGLMRSSIGFEVLSDYAVLIGSPREYADYHQNAKKESRRRQFLGLGTEDIADLGDVIDAFLEKHFS